MQSLKTRSVAGRLTAGVLFIMILSVCLAITTFALVYSMVSVENNIFTTGAVKINLNNGMPIIGDNEVLFEPGMTVKKSFFVKNEGTCDVFYKLYFQNLGGGLEDVLEVKICDGDEVLYKGTPRSLSRENVIPSNKSLSRDEIAELQIYFHFPAKFDSKTQGMYLSFDFAVDAVQAKNNPNKEFNK